MTTDAAGYNLSASWHNVYILMDGLPAMPAHAPRIAPLTPGSPGLRAALSCNSVTKVDP
jgi:hypothetical protein